MTMRLTHEDILFEIKKVVSELETVVSIAKQHEHLTEDDKDSFIFTEGYLQYLVNEQLRENLFLTDYEKAELAIREEMQKSMK